MYSVLIIGPRFHNFCTAISEAFVQLGFSVSVEHYDVPVHPYTTLMKWEYKLCSNKEKLKTKSRKQYQEYIENRFKTTQPNMVFALNGDILLPETLDLFRKSAKVVLWAFDSITRFPFITHLIDHVDYMFCYEKQDIELFASQNKQAYFFPQACDTSTYHITNIPSKDIDIVFVGEIYYSKKRAHYIQELVKAFPNKNIRVFGLYKPWYKSPLKCLFRERRDIFANHNIPCTEVNDYYNRSKIVLNIHHEQQKNGANPKVFEICGAGAYQICDANPYIESLFPNGEVGLYHNEAEMIALIQDALQNDKSKQAAAAHKIIIEQHTFEQRIKTMLNMVGMPVSQLP